MKIVVSIDNAIFCIEFVFNLLQRRVFGNCKLDLNILTSNVEKVKEIATNIEKCAFSNMNGK